MQFRDLKRQYDVLRYEIDGAIQSVLSTSTFIGGEPVAKLEQELLEYVGIAECITCANGTDALTLSMRAHGIGKGDFVFVPAFSYIASASTISLVGAIPVFVDVDKRTFNIDCDALEKAILDFHKYSDLSPKAIIAVDLFGLPFDYERLTKIAKRENLLIIEDCAQGFGGRIRNRKACSFGDISTTSFFPAKPLGCYGDGGAIFTNDKEIADRIRMLKSNGASPTDKYDNLIIGTNSRLDSLQAAILSIKLRAFIDTEIEAVNKVARMYLERLSGSMQVPVVPDGFYSAWAQFTIVLKNHELRDGLKKRLADRGIPSMIYYKKPLHLQKAFEGIKQFNNSMQISEFLAERVLSLPMHPYLTVKEVDLVCNEIHKYIKGLKR